MTTEKLKELRKATDAAIDRIKKDPSCDAVNWAHLHCTEASWVTTDSGHGYAMVEIEEVASDAAEFQQRVYLALLEAGWPSVRVVTEW